MVLIGISIDQYNISPTKTKLPHKLKPYCSISSYKHSQVIESANCGVDGHGSHRERRLGPGTRSFNLQRVDGCALQNNVLWCVSQASLLTVMRGEMTLHVTLWLNKTKEKSLVSRPGERRLFRSLQTRLCFCTSLNTGVVIIFGLHPAIPPSPTHCGLIDFYKVWRVN